MSDIKNNNFLKIEIGKRIDIIRTQKGMTKDKFAELLNISRQHLNQVINGESGLSIEKTIELSEKTGFPTDFILLGKTDSLNNDVKKLLIQSKTDIKELYENISKIITLIK